MRLKNIHNPGKIVEGFKMTFQHLISPHWDVPLWIRDKLIVTNQNVSINIAVRPTDRPDRGGYCGKGSKVSLKFEKHILKENDWVLKSETKGVFILSHNNLIQNYTAYDTEKPSI